MRQFNITGMSCAACSARIEKVVGALDGVEECQVNLLTNSMTVKGEEPSDNIIKAVIDSGYGIKDLSKQENDTEENISFNNSDISSLTRRLIISIFFLLVLMYFSMGHMMFGFPVPSFFVDNHVALGILQLLLTLVVMIVNQHFFVSGFKGLIRLAPNMDTLVSLGAAAAFVYSTVWLFIMTGYVIDGELGKAMSSMHEFYFESSAMILTLITLGKLLEAKSKGRTTDALRSLIELAPKKACVIRDGVETKVLVRDVLAGEEFVVRSGENIPVDGEIVEGLAAINESAMTGESIPNDKKAGDTVLAGTINESGFIKCIARRVGNDTTLAQIIKTVNDSAAAKAPIAKAADKVSGIFVPVVMLISLVTFVVWLLVGEEIGFALARAITVLVISCPCALGLATPVAIMVGNGIGARNNILFKSAESLEMTGKTKIAVFDKTGTITKGEPEVTDIFTVNEISKSMLLSYAYAVEQKSEHPISRAIVSEAVKRGVDLVIANDFVNKPGSGIIASVNGNLISIGNYDFICEKAQVSIEMKEKSEYYSKDGKTPVFIAIEDKCIGIIAVADSIREESVEAIARLKSMGIYTLMLTGDNKTVANAIGKQAGVDEVIADVFPQDKERVIDVLKNRGHVTMIGDGINDAPALTSADTGIAIGNGTDIAIDSAQVVLMKSSLRDVPAAISLSRRTLRAIHQNLFWAFFYNAIGIPLAAGVWIPITGWRLSPAFGALAMSFSSFCVVLNALRLNLIDIYSLKGDKINRKKVNEGECKMNIKKTIEIEGMMCSHCEGRVRDSLTSLNGVEEAKVSHEEKNAVVSLSSDVNDSILVDAVEKAGYKVITIK